MAMENLSIAQHRDTLRYARIRSGAYWPQLRPFSTGDYVYLQREAPMTLDVKALFFVWRMCCLMAFCYWKARMAGSVGSTLRIVLHAIYPLMVQFILSWPLCLKAFRILCVVRRRERPPCCYVTIVNVDGIWLVWHFFFLLYCCGIGLTRIVGGLQATFHLMKRLESSWTCHWFGALPSSWSFLF